MKEHITQKHKGFTLVELLIVIVVIGILSAMMMLSSSEAVSSAKATAIVSDLRNIKTAALAYFADHADDNINKTPSDKDTIPRDDWLPYLNGKDFPNKDNYTVIYKGSKTAWYAECNVNALLKGTELAAVQKKLAGRAKSVGLLGTDAAGVYGASGVDQKYVLMLIE